MLLRLTSRDLGTRVCLASLSNLQLLEEEVVDKYDVHQAVLRLNCELLPQRADAPPLVLGVVLCRNNRPVAVVRNWLVNHYRRRWKPAFALMSFLAPFLLPLIN